MAFVLVQEESGDKMRPKVVCTGRRKQFYTNWALVGKSEKSPNGQLRISLTGLRFYNYQLKRSIMTQ